MRSRLLVIHFLRRFLDNDLISPDADRHEVLAVTFAALSTSGIFLTVLLSIKYLFRPIQSRGWTVMVSLDDTFVWTGLSMIVMALVALAVWDALALDARDTAILGPLPVRRRALVGAQLAAVIIFATVFAVVLNAIPSVLAPLIRVSRLPIGWLAILRLVAAHAVVAMAAGFFGFVTVLGVRELLRAVLGSDRFQQVSALVQGTLVVLLATSFLLLPALSTDVGRRWLTSASPRFVPPLWFVGLHEALAGDALAGLPAVLPKADAPAYVSIVAFEARMIRAYDDKRPILAELRRLALVGLGVVTAVAAAAWTWNGRRWPALTVPRMRRRGRRLRSACARLLLATLARRPMVAAGFFFTLQTLARSAPHRVVLATTLGVATAAAAFTLRGIDAAGVLEPTVVPLGVFAMQTVVLMVVVTGLRHATRVPADLRAGGTFLLTAAGNGRQFLEGVKRAGIAGAGVSHDRTVVPCRRLAGGTAPRFSARGVGAAATPASRRGAVLPRARVAAGLSRRTGWERSSPGPVVSGRRAGDRVDGRARRAGRLGRPRDHRCAR